MRFLPSLLSRRCAVPGAILTTLSALPLMLAAAAPALAQGTPPGDAPPTLERLDEGQQPPVTIRPDGSATPGSTDTRDPSGRVTETRVQTGGTTYYVRPNSSPGNAQSGDLQSSGNRAAQFKIKEFDLGSRKAPKQQGDAPQTLEPASPPVMPGKN